MTDSTLQTSSSSPVRADMVPKFFATDCIVTPDGNPVYTSVMLADLLASIRDHTQLVPGWVAPSPELDDDQRLCLEGNRRLQVARLLGLPFWAFDLGRIVPEAERIVLTFNHNSTRRVMSRDEVANRAARYIDLTGCTAAEAARVLNVSAATLSRAFGEKRIPAELRQRADSLGLSTRSLIAACSVDLMERAIAYAEKPLADGRKPTRDQVSSFINHLKKGATKTRKTRTVSLRVSGRAVTVELSDGDNADSVSKDLAAIVKKLGTLTNVQPEGWPFLFV